MKIDHLTTHSQYRLPLMQGLILFGLFLFFNTTAFAQVTFVQITDPHIFDDNWVDKDPAKTEDNRLNNRAALTSCLWSINERIKKGAKYDFGVITGDLGIEFLAADLAKNKASAKLDTAASDFASMLALSGIRKWFVVPGNNDVLCEDPENIRYYHMFIASVSNALAKDGIVSIIDLCPQDNSNLSQWDSRSEMVQINGYSFIGFNDSSFKNDPEPDKPCLPADRIGRNANLQKNYIVQVEELLKKDNSKAVYIFYHIPEIDDPYSVTLKPNQEPLKTRYTNHALIGESFFDSSWFVKKDVRDEWDKVVMNPKVKGLFAGHFHDNKRQSYLGFQWLRTPNYPPETLSKLHVCPPLALKLQYDKSERARGFEEVYIDDKGEVSTRVVWFNQGIWGPSNEIEAKESESLRQLELGDAYENNGRLKEAEAAYLKAAESTWPPTRQRSLYSAKRVIESENSFLEQYVLAPFRTAFTAGITTFWSALLGVLVAVGLAFLFVRPLRWWGKRKGANKLQILPIQSYPKALGASLQQIIIMINGRIGTHFKQRILVTGRPKLPLIARSQSAEVTELVESIVPSGPGKIISWLLKNTDRSQYSIGGTIQDRFRGVVVFISLQESGETLRTWQEIDPEHEILRNEIRLAFASLKFLVRRMNQ